jgi:peptide subunit release factor 1 (eRF1)
VDEYVELFQPPNGKRHGLVWSTGDSADFYELPDHAKASLRKLKSIGICRQKSQKKGGQSAARIGRLRDNQVAGFHKSVAEMCNELFLDVNGRPSILTLCFGGTGGPATGIYSLASKSPHLNKTLVPLVIGAFATDKIASLVDASATCRQRAGDTKSNHLVSEFLEHVRLDTGKAVYGPAELKANIDQLQSILIHPDKKEQWITILDHLGPKTTVTALASPVLLQYGGLVAISYFSLIA